MQVNQINLISFRMQCQAAERKGNLIMYSPFFFLNKACVKSHRDVATSSQTEKTEGKKGLTKTGRRTSRIVLLTAY